MSGAHEVLGRAATSASAAVAIQACLRAACARTCQAARSTTRGNAGTATCKFVTSTLSGVVVQGLRALRWKLARRAPLALGCARAQTSKTFTECRCRAPLSRSGSASCRARGRRAQPTRCAPLTTCKTLAKHVAVHSGSKLALALARRSDIVCLNWEMLFKKLSDDLLQALGECRRRGERLRRLTQVSRLHWHADIKRM